ncbi:hypothetical protein ACOMHN_046346 [Nucella lapillus]
MNDISSATGNYFEVPKHTYCVGAKNTRTLPSMPPSYSFDSEILDLNANTVGFIREEYDNLTSLLRLDYRDPPSVNSPFQTRYITQIHDYKTGVAYLIDVFRANCTMKFITGADFDNTITANGKLRLRNPNEFMDLNHNYTYQGIRTIRGIECDTWSAERRDFPIAAIKNPPSVWTLYFATPLTPIHKHQSFYEYNVGEPDINSWDISSCYSVKQSRNFAFLVSGKVKDLANGDVKKFKYYVLTNLIMALGMSGLRFSKMDVQDAGDDTLVSFVMLDKAPFIGDVTNPPDEPSLDKAYDGLNSAVNSGKLKFMLFNNLNKVLIKPVGPKYQELLSKRGGSSSNDTPITGGGMGGMAVGMLILGGLLGFLIMFLVYKRKGGTFGWGGLSMNRFGTDKEQVVSND